MNTEHFQINTAYLDGALMSLEGDKVVILTYQDKQERFYINEQGDVNRCGEQGPIAGSESDFEVYRMAFLEALLNGGSLIVRQVGVSSFKLPAELGGAQVPVDFLSGAVIGSKGLRPLAGEQLKASYGNNFDGAVEFRSFPSKEQVKAAMVKQIESAAA